MDDAFHGQHNGIGERLAVWIATVGLVFGLSTPVAAAGEVGDDVAPSFSTAEEVVDDERVEEPDRAELATDEAQELAGRLDSAMEHESNGEFERSRREFVEAYDVHPHSNILLSVARTSAEMGDDEVALRGYRAFLDRQPDYENREAIEERITAIEQRRDESFVGSLQWPSEVGWSGTTAMVVGIGALVGAGGLASSVDSDFEAMEDAEARGDWDEYGDRARTIGGKQMAGRILLYGGAGLAAVGLSTLLVDVLYLDRPPLFGGTGSGTSTAAAASFDGDGFSIQWIYRF